MTIMKWGNTVLNIIKDSYMPPLSIPKLTVIDILPDGTTYASSVIQSGGRGRYQVSFNGSVDSYAEYESLMNDYIAMTERTFTGADGFSQTMIISALQPIGRRLYPLKIEYSITLMEA